MNITLTSALGPVSINTDDIRGMEPYRLGTAVYLADSNDPVIVDQTRDEICGKMREAAAAIQHTEEPVEKA